MRGVESCLGESAVRRDRCAIVVKDAACDGGERSVPPPSRGSNHS